VSATPSEGSRSRLILGSLVALLVLIGATGVVRVTIDSGAPYVLPEDHPVEVATRALRGATGGDDVILVAVFGATSVLDDAGVRTIESIRQGMAAAPTLDGVRAVTNAPLLALRDGVLTVETPLLPSPAPGAAERVLADRFAVGPLVGETGRVAVVAGWIRRVDADAALVARATGALADPELRSTEAGALVGKVVNEARLAVVLGQAEGPADKAVAQGLRALATEGPATDLVAGWLVDAERAAADPDGEALAQTRSVVDGLELPTGVQAVVLGAPAVTQAVSDAFPSGVALLLTGLVLGAALAAGRSQGGLLPSARAGGAGGIAALLATGAMGWAGAPLHGVSALAPVLAAGVAGVLAGPRARTFGPTAAALLPLVGLGIGLGHVEGALFASLAGVGAGALLGVLSWSFSESSEFHPPARGEGSAVVIVAGLIAVGCIASLIRPAGLDPSRLLDGRHVIGEATAALDEDAGMGAPAQLVLVGEGDRPMAAPAALRALREAQTTLESADGVRGTVSWADFVGAIHELVAQAEVGTLPEDPALVDQYLLLFGRPDATRPLVAPDLSVGSGMVRLEPGQGARLARLARLFDDGPVRLGGEAVRIAVASLRTVRSAGLGLLLGAVLAIGLALVREPRGTATDLLLTLAACLAAAAATAGWAHALTLEAAAAAGLVFAASRAGPGAGLVLAGAALAALSPVVPVASLGVGLAVGGVVLVALRDLHSGGAQRGTLPR